MISYSEEQLKAINLIEGQVSIISVAGSGKTSVIVARANKIVNSGVPAHRILVLTFSKAAASQMAQRYQSVFGASGIRFSTIHSLCYSVLARAYNLAPESILSESDKTKFFMELHRQFIFKKVAAVSEDFDEFYRKCNEYVSRASEVEYCGIKDNIEGYSKNEQIYLKSAYEQYNSFKRNNKKLDFDDLIIYCHKCLQNNKNELEYWQSVFDYVMVDEFQDTGMLQADIIYKVADHKKNICVVGDDDQSIYGFRGADSLVFKDFEKRYPKAQRIMLSTNYRSLSFIIKGADKVIKNNANRISKNMKAYRKGEGKIHIRPADTQNKQADMVIALVNEYVKKGGNLSDVAVLYRVKKEASALVSMLETIGLPFYTRDNVEDIHMGLCFGDMLAYYRLSRGIPTTNDLVRISKNALGDISDLRIPTTNDLVRIINRPKRYIKNNLIRNCEFDRNKIYEAATKNASQQECLRINDAINDMFLDLRSLSKIDNPTQFINYIYENMGYESSLLDYAEYTGIDMSDILTQSESMKKEALKLDNMADWYKYITDRQYRQRTDKDSGIYLSTFHSAKGLEWKKVIIISANEQVTPYAYMGKVEDYEEERRLFYVAMTRAKDELDILYIDGILSKRDRSRYVNELMRENVSVN